MYVELQITYDAKYQISFGKFLHSLQKMQIAPHHWPTERHISLDGFVDRQRPQRIHEYLWDIGYIMYLIVKEWVWGLLNKFIIR